MQIEAEKMTIVKQTIDTSALVKAATSVISPLLRQKPLEYVVEIGESVPKKFIGDFSHQANTAQLAFQRGEVYRERIDKVETMRGRVLPVQ